MKRTIRKPGKYLDDSGNSTMRSTITLKEKKQFLLALRQNGFNVINDLEKLQTYLPSRSLQELQSLIESYNRKGKILANKILQEDIEGVSYLNNWYSILSSRIPFTSKKDDLAEILPELVEELKSSMPSGSIDYRRIYSFLIELMLGKFPSQLSILEAKIVLTLIDSLTNFINETDTEEAKNYLKNDSWTKNIDVEHKESLQKEFSDSSVNSCETHEGASTSNSSKNLSVKTTSLSEVDDESIESYCQLSKIQKIKHCLNPLDIPTKLSENVHNSLKIYLNKR